MARYLPSPGATSATQRRDERKPVNGQPLRQVLVVVPGVELLLHRRRRFGHGEEQAAAAHEAVIRPFLDAIAAVGEALGECAVLLAHQHREARALQLARSPRPSAARRAAPSPSEGSSSRMASGLPIRVRAMASIFCSPPDIAAPRRSLIAARVGKSAKRRSSSQAGSCRLAAAAPDLEVFRDGQLGEDAPVLGNVAEAEPRDFDRARGRRCAGRRSARRRVRATRPMIALSVVDLPAPLRPSRATTSPARELEAHVEQDLRAAVAGLQVLATSSSRQGRPPARAGRPVSPPVARSAITSPDAARRRGRRGRTRRPCRAR